MALVRLVVFGYLFLTIIYWLIVLYSRSVRREKLENAWAEDHPEGADNGARDTYIAQGMDAYNNGLRPKLIGLVYVIPTIAVAVIIYVINSN